MESAGGWPRGQGDERPIGRGQEHRLAVSAASYEGMEQSWGMEVRRMRPARRRTSMLELSAYPNNYESDLFSRRNQVIRTGS